MQNEDVNGHYNNIDFKCADVTSPDLNIAAGSADLVFSNWLLMYLSDEEVKGLASRVMEWLRPGGYIFFRESCFHQSGDHKRKNNPTHYRQPNEYTNVSWITVLYEVRLSHLGIIFVIAAFSNQKFDFVYCMYCRSSSRPTSKRMGPISGLKWSDANVSAHTCEIREIKTRCVGYGGKFSRMDLRASVSRSFWTPNSTRQLESCVTSVFLEKDLLVRVESVSIGVYISIFSGMCQDALILNPY